MNITPLGKQQKLLLPLLLLLLFGLVTQPETAYEAAGQGLSLWWQVVAPALLPFFMVSELLLELGVSAYLGPLLTRFMGPVFALPGSAALAVAMGFCSGFPTGAAITLRLRQQQLLTQEEAERLTAFTNNAGPLYITVSVAIGLLGWPRAGLILAISHYGANLLLGIALGLLARLRGWRSSRPAPPPEAAKTWHSLGAALKNAAQNGSNNLLLIGCYMVFFSVLTALLEPLFSKAPTNLQGILLGLFEMSLGINRLALHSPELAYTLPWVAALLSFGGASVQIQVLSILSGSDIRPGCYLLCRLLQAVLSYALAYVLVLHSALPTLHISTLSFLAAPWWQHFALCLMSSALLLMDSPAVTALYRRKK